MYGSYVTYLLININSPIYSCTELLYISTEYFIIDCIIYERNYLSLLSIINAFTNSIPSDE